LNISIFYASLHRSRNMNAEDSEKIEEISKFINSFECNTPFQGESVQTPDFQRTIPQVSQISHFSSMN
jgi:hypothetical protein